MRRRVFGILAVAVLLSSLAAPAQAAEPDESAPAGSPPAFPQAGTDKLARDSWIVTLLGDVNARTAAPGLARKAGGSVGAVYTHAISGFQFKGSANGAAALRNNPNVRSVTKDRAMHLSESAPFGVSRIDAFVVGGGDAYAAGYRGTGSRIAVIDTGIDLDHPDLVASIDAAAGKNCINPALAPNDGHGHGTHVAGTAAAPYNDVGVIGVAPEATLVPVKVFDDAGNSSEALVLCGIDHVVALNTDAVSANDIDVANMSFGDPRAWGSCADDPLHGAICAADAAGVVLIGGAGNNAANADTFVPAAFPEVLSVSAMADFDGVPGGAGGCPFIPSLLWYQCDDAFAFFSNYGPSVDVIAPGVNVYSTWKDGGYQTQSGTSMATPHVAGVAALVRAANPSLTPAQVRSIIVETGEFPDGETAESGCGASTGWSGDPDGITEPMVNALRAAQRAANPSSGGAPEVTLTPADGSAVSGNVELSATASHASGIASVEFSADGSVVGTDTTAPYSATWDATLTFDGAHVIRAKASATTGSAKCVANAVSVGVNSQGDWVGVYGVDGYALGAWSQSSGTDLSVLPAGVSYALEQGGRSTAWPQPTADVRALESPDEAERRAGAWYHATEIRLRLTFAAAYTGTLHLYAVDWDTTARRQNVTVTDGTTSKTVSITTAFNAGAWMHVPVSVGAGGSVLVTVTKTSGKKTNAVLSGLFLGGAGPPLSPPGTG